jgi:hypothetical protein
LGERRRQLILGAIIILRSRDNVYQKMVESALQHASLVGHGSQCSIHDLPTAATLNQAASTPGHNGLDFLTLGQLIGTTRHQRSSSRGCATSGLLPKAEIGDALTSWHYTTREREPRREGDKKKARTKFRAFVVSVEGGF